MDTNSIVKNKWHLSFFLPFIFLLAVILRIYDLGAESLWFDEVGSIDLAMRDPSVLFFKFHNSPLYFLLLKYWMKIWGISEFALRSLSVIFGIGSIFLIYKVGRLLFNKKVGIVSAFLLSISPVHIFYSQEARNYSLLVFLTLLSMLIFIKLLRENHVWLYICLGLINILLVYTLLHGVLVIICQNILFFLNDNKGKQKKKWITVQAVILIFFLPWFIPVTISVLEEPWTKVSTSWIQKPNFSILIETFRTFSYGGERYGGADFHISSKDLQIYRNVSHIFGILFFLGIFFQAKSGRHELDDKRNKQAILLLSLWLFLSILITLLFSIVFFPLYVIRYIIFALCPFLIIIAVGVTKIKNYFVRAGIILAITILTVFALNTYYAKELKIAWREAFSYINENIKDNDVIIVSLAEQARLFGYYGKNGLKNREGNILNMDRTLGSILVTGGFVYTDGENKLIGINNLEQLKRIMNSTNAVKKDSGIWLVITRWSEGKNYPEPIKKYIDNFYQDKKHRYFPGVSVYYYSPSFRGYNSQNRRQDQ